jgi:AraC-like DNA-binding protein
MREEFVMELQIKNNLSKTVPFQIREYVYREYQLSEEFPVEALVKENFKFPSEPETITWLHFHNCMEIMVCYEERIVNIENRIYSMEPESICVIPPNQMHNSKRAMLQENARDPGCEYLYLDPKKLLEDFFTETYSFQQVFEQINRNLTNGISSHENPKIWRIIQMILEEMRNPDFSHYMVKGLFLSFWIELLRTLKLPSASHMAKRRELTSVYPAMVHIREHYAEKVTTETLAEICHMSVSYFRQSFKKLVGISSGKYLDHIRLAKSCELLLETELSILEIALSCGFTSLSAYNNHFIARYGVSPGQWKKERRNIKKTAYSHSVYRPEKKANI